jgi:hypothetical protein
MTAQLDHLQNSTRLIGSVDIHPLRIAIINESLVLRAVKGFLNNQKQS